MKQRSKKSSRDLSQEGKLVMHETSEAYSRDPVLIPEGLVEVLGKKWTRWTDESREALFNAWIDAKRAVWSESSVPNAVYYCRLLKRYGWPGITPTQLLKKAQADGYSHNSVALLFVRAVGVETDMLGKTEMRRFVRANRKKLSQKEIPLQRVLTQEQVETLISTAMTVAPHLVNFLILGAYAGLRKSELLALRWSDVNYNEERIVVQKGKGDKTRVIPVPRKILDRLVNNHTHKVVAYKTRISRDPVYFLERIREITGIDFTPHDLRRFCLTFYSTILTPDALQRIAGHSSFDTTMRYILFNEKEALRRLKEKL